MPQTSSVPPAGALLPFCYVCLLLCPIIGVSSVTSLLYDSMISGVFDGVLRGV